MRNSRAGRLPAYIVFAVLLASSLAVNAYLAYRISYPPRTLRIGVVLDSQDPTAVLFVSEAKRRIGAIAPLFQRAAGIEVVYGGTVYARIRHEKIDAEELRSFLDVRAGRADVDLLVAFWSPAPGDSSLGSAPPFTSIAVVRLGSGSPASDDAVLAHQLLSLFGLPASSDSNSVMFASPHTLTLDPKSSEILAAARLFDFPAGLAGMSRREESHILDAIARQPDLHGDPPQLRLADLIMRDAHPAAAVPRYRAAVKVAPSNLAAHIGLSRSLAISSNLTEAETEARAAVKLAPNSGDSHFQLGYVLVRTGKTDEAIDEFRRAISLDPKSGRNHAGLATAYFASVGEFEEANRELETAKKMDPNNPLIQAAIRDVERVRTEIDQETTAVEAEIRLDPKSGPAHERYAGLLLRRGKVSQAISEIREALRLGPENWQMHYLLSVALYASHDFAGAQSEFENAKRRGSGTRPRLEEALRVALARGPASTK
jgi:Flp pilus assembly protein TadD